MLLDRNDNMFGQIDQQRYIAAGQFHENHTAEEGYISTDEDEAAADKWEPHPINQRQVFIS